MRRTLVTLSLLLVCVVAGCRSPASVDHVAPADRAASQQASPFRPCPTSTQRAATATLPEVTLPCFTGGEPVALAALGRPAVINFWASYCGPCRDELPELQRFADAANDKLVVLGVVTNDVRSKAASAATDFGVTFPAVFDSDSTLLRALGRNFLPVTLFVDADGRIQHEDISGKLTMAELAQLARLHLGVDVS